MAREKCLNRSKDQIRRHMTGFDGEQVAFAFLRKHGFKKARLTHHKDPFDILTDKGDVFEIKSFKSWAKHKQTKIEGDSLARKLAYAEKNKIKKSNRHTVMCIIDGDAQLYIKRGELGNFRPGGMEKLGIIKNWRSKVGNARLHRKVLSKSAVRDEDRILMTLYGRKEEMLTPAKLKKWSNLKHPEKFDETIKKMIARGDVIDKKGKYGLYLPDEGIKTKLGTIAKLDTDELASIGKYKP